MFFNFLLIFSFIVFPKRVILHLEKVPDGIIHTGVSFNTPFKKRRYDFRIFNENNTCLTTGLVRSDPKVLFPNLYEKDSDANTRKLMEDFFSEIPEIIYRDICLGTTNKTFYEIENYSKLFLIKYILINFSKVMQFVELIFQIQVTLLVKEAIFLPNTSHAHCLHLLLEKDFHHLIA